MSRFLGALVSLAGMRVSACATAHPPASEVATIRGIIETSAKDGQLAGSVRGSPGDDVGIAGAHVTVSGTSFKATTRRDGRFVLERIPIGVYEIMIAATGFDTVRVPAFAVRATVELDATLRETSVPVAPITSAPIMPREPSSSGTTAGHWRYPTLPMLIVDGVISLQNEPWPDLVSMDLARIRVISGDAATHLYGQRSALGAFIIETRRRR